MKVILGISAFYHDSAACLIKDGKIIAAAQEERFTRIKHDSNYPYHSIEYVLNFSGYKLSQVDKIIFYEKPFLKLDRLIKTYVLNSPKGFSSFTQFLLTWLQGKIFQKKRLFKYLKKHDENFTDKNKITFSEHHLSHAASAFFPSPFQKAVVLTADGVGEWATTTVAIGHENKLEIKKEIRFPHSLGLLYSSFTYFAGFKVNSGEYKLMGLAPYGKPIFYEIIKNKLIKIKSDGSFKLNQEYFDYSVGFKMTSEKFNQLFKNKPRNPKKEKITQFHMDLAASIQKVTEEVIIKIVKSLKKEYKIENLCLAGGVALNCVANGKIIKNRIFKNIWVQPASGDAGGSLGAALAYWHLHLKEKRIVEKKDAMRGSYLGPEFSQLEIEERLKKIGAKYKLMSDKLILDKSAELIKEGKVIGWFQGRMEFGPRALGSRSILGDPRSQKMQKTLNMKVKFRESFRPFAPSILKDNLNDWFELNIDSPYMLLVSNVNHKIQKKMTMQEEKLFGIEKLNISRSEIPAVTHVDYSARIQTVDGEYNKKFFELLKKFKDLTGCPVLINTSFNVRGEPIVNTPEDAFNCFMGTELDALIIGNYCLLKNDQKDFLKNIYKDKFELD
tara:strand:+ start:29928 stop:31766 length:1839 start_codon:yes stop_codon:yes gene_type:complete